MYTIEDLKKLSKIITSDKDIDERCKKIRDIIGIVTMEALREHEVNRKIIKNHRTP